MTSHNSRHEQGGQVQRLAERVRDQQRSTSVEGVQAVPLVGIEERDRLLEGIQRAFDRSRTPIGLRESLEAFARDNAEQVRRLDVSLLGSLAWWVEMGREAGHDPDLVEQVALQSAGRAIALMARAMKARQGEPFDPARLAIVAFFLAEDVANLPTVNDRIDRAKTDLDDLLAGEGDAP